jgi:hypothetical protein
MPVLEQDALAYPFVRVNVVPPPAPRVSRNPGVIAILGKTPDGDPGGQAPINAPRVVSSAADAINLFASRTGAGAEKPTPLSTSLQLALNQDPGPAKIYGVRVKGNDYAAALTALEAVDDVTFVGLAKETDVAALGALRAHVDTISKTGSKRMGVAMADPARALSQTWAKDTVTALKPAGGSVMSDDSRMVVVAGRASTIDLAPDFAMAAMAAIAGLEPQVSPVLKQVRGTPIPKELQFSPSEIKDLAQEGIIPIIDPELISGEGQYMADGVLFTTDNRRPYVDITRVLDDIEFKLRAGLIGAIGDARITRPGLTLVKSIAEGILGVLQRRAVIDSYSVTIPVLDVLSIPENARVSADNDMIKTARTNRQIDMVATVVYGPQVHQIGVKFQMTFV